MRRSAEAKSLVGAGYQIVFIDQFCRTEGLALLPFVPHELCSKMVNEAQKITGRAGSGLYFI
jgi:hypothetical protein